jgi:hypothetical protein
MGSVFGRAVMEISGILGMSLKCWFSWISICYIANYIELTHQPLLEIYPFSPKGKWKAIICNLLFYYALSFVIVGLHVTIWSSTGLDESDYVTKLAIFVAVIHGAIAAYLILRNRKKDDRKPMAAAVMYWHILCGLFVGIVLEIDILQKWLIP